LTKLAKSVRLPIWAIAPAIREEIAMMEPGTPVAAYLRVSTMEQAEHGNGLGAQETQVREYCEERGFRLVHVYREEGVSGTNGIEGRRELPRMLVDLEQGHFDGIVIARLDRLARDLMLQETILADIRRRGGVLVSVAEPDLCETDPGRTFVRQIYGGLAQYEKAVLSARLVGGRLRKRASGGYAGGELPLGYRVRGKGRTARVVVDQGEAEIVQRIFDDYEAGASMKTIARTLTREGIKSKRGGTWMQATIGKILRNEAYVDGRYPPIIDRVQWAACTKRRRSHFKRNREQSVA
jgi:site-specific DNA recombinase